MKQLRKILAGIMGMICISVMMGRTVMAVEGEGADDPPAKCNGDGCIVSQAWVRTSGSKSIHSVGGNRIYAINGTGGADGNTEGECNGSDLYFLATIYYHKGVGYSWDGSLNMKSAHEMITNNYDIQYHDSILVGGFGIAESGSEKAVKYAFSGNAEFVPFSKAEEAYNKPGAKNKLGWSNSSRLGWFCSPGTTPPPPTVTPETETETETTTYDGKTEVDYSQGGTSYHGGDTVEITPGNPEQTEEVEPNFSHCLWTKSGGDRAVDLQTQYNVPANESKTKTSWGRNVGESNCEVVKTAPKKVTTKMGDTVKVCQTIGFYATVTRKRTKTRTKTTVNGQVTYSSWTYGNWTVTRKNWTTREACISFKQPYYYKDGEYTYSGKVTGTTENQALNGCQSIVSENGNSARDCFIKSKNADNGKTTVKFRDEIEGSGGETGNWRKDGEYDSRSGEFGTAAMATNWRTVGITPASGTSSGGIVRDYGANKREDVTIKLGFSLLEEMYNMLEWDRTVKYVKRSDGKYLVTYRSGYDGKTKVTFNLYHPYNYNTSVSAEIQKDLYVGSTGTATVSASYDERENNTVTGNNEKYRTALPTHAGRYYAVFTVDSAAASAVKELTKDGGTTFWERDNNDPDNLCGVVKRGVTGVNDCEQSEIGTASQIGFKVPDDYGAKVCVVAGVNYADSHGAPDSAITAEMNKGIAAVPNLPRDTVNINSPYWRVSWAACESVKAKPRVQNWNAGFYTEGKVNMSVENKVPGQVFSLNNAGNTKTFGSWSETSFIQGKDSTGFASSSKLGGTGMSDYSFCKSSPVSIANVGSGATCTEATSKLTASGITSATADTVAKTLMRYMPSAKDLDGGSIDKSGKLAEVGGKEPGVYEYHAGNADIGEMMVNLKNNSTKIIIVRGTARIKGNICVGGGTCSSNGSLIIKDRNDEKVSNIVDLANVVIIADKIEISPDVTQIDAILMALGNGGVEAREMKTSGEIDTCSGLDKTNEKVQACMKTLYVNGPVFAGKLKLNRTIYKTGEGKNITPAQDLQEMGSATAAEVFNLNPYVYMWAFEQASRYTQAETVYTQELAPRL